VNINLRVKQSLVAMTVLTAVSATCVAADTETVSQRGRRFTPDAMQVTTGTSVKIENDDRVTHHVYVDQPDMKFDSGEQSVGNAVSLQFDRAGTFVVRCAIHPTMRLDVTVVPANSK
jgi:cytochrome c peroxidase